MLGGACFHLCVAVEIELVPVLTCVLLWELSWFLRRLCVAVYPPSPSMYIPPFTSSATHQATARGFVPLLIVNMQMPLYNPGYFGAHDGQGGSLIYFFCFPPGWHPDSVTNPAALKLLEAFFNDDLCMDGTPARERLKLIPRVSNVDEWARVGPLSATEHRLLSTYNDKPVLTRPQQRFYRGPGYLEVRMLLMRILTVVCACCGRILTVGIRAWFLWLWPGAYRLNVHTRVPANLFSQHMVLFPYRWTWTCTLGTLLRARPFSAIFPSCQQ